MVTLYNAVSEDGFIARKDGSEDFLEILAADDVIAMGRKTYEVIQAYPSVMIRFFESQPMQRSYQKDFSPKEGYVVRSSLLDISDSGKSILITSGPSVNTAALQAGIIDRI